MACRALAAEVFKLKAENKRLRRRLNVKLNRVRRQKKFLDMLRTFTWYYYCQAEKVLDRPSGVKRMDWAYAKGMAYAAGRLYHILMFDYSALVRDLL